MYFFHNLILRIASCAIFIILLYNATSNLNEEKLIWRFTNKIDYMNSVWLTTPYGEISIYVDYFKKKFKGNKIPKKLYLPLNFKRSLKIFNPYSPEFLSNYLLPIKILHTDYNSLIDQKLLKKLLIIVNEKNSYELFNGDFTKKFVFMNSYNSNFEKNWAIYVFLQDDLSFIFTLPMDWLNLYKLK